MEHAQHNKQNLRQQSQSSHHYKKLILMVALSFITMYILMYSMVNNLSNVFNNVNQFYMAGLMASPMVIIEILLMRMMYNNSKLNTIIIIGAAILMFGFYQGIRQQAAVGDKQFLRSMIPHHASAILMGKKAKVTDPEIKQLIQNIITSQQQEIDQMKAKLQQLKK